MKNKKRFFHRLLAGFGVVVLVTGIFAYTHTLEASEIAKTRGRVNVDLEDFILVETTSDDAGSCGLSSQDSSNSRYLLYYDNTFTDRNNIGCTYRSSVSYDMTDVTAIEMFAYSQQDSNDKVMFYVDPGTKTYYHRMDRDDITTELVKGDGTVQELSYFYYLAYGATPQDYKFGITQRYGNEYVYLGMSHEWLLHEARLYLDNKTIASSTEGCINLHLKKHNITLLEPEPFTLIQADGSEKTVSAFANLTLGLEDGEYEVGETGAVYRDESVTLNYTLADAGMCNLTGFCFYSDAEKENLLYTMDVEGESNQSTFIFDSALIKTLEEKTGEFQLSSLYVEPIFTSEEVTFEFVNVVPEYDGLEVVKTSDENVYQLREITTESVVGTFTKNAAGKIGDTFVINYEANAEYEGDYAFRYYEIRECEAENQVSTTDWSIAHYTEEENVHDVELEFKETYFWIRAHVGKDMKVELQDVETTFSNKSVQAEKAKVSWQGEEVEVDEDDIIYQYYTDSACTEASLMEEYPINAGTYYVKATLKSTNEYDAADSNVAKIVIHKATPVLKKIRATGITYGQTLAESAGFSGTVEGVSGTTVQGTFTWADDSLILNAGNQSAEIIFTPGELYAQNYAEVSGKAAISVAQATPSITLENREEVFFGGPVSLDTGKAVGIYGEETGQLITYEYYPTAECNKADRTTVAPTNAGTYYVLASTAAKGNYGYVKTSVEEAAILTITPYQTKLIQVPVGEYKELDGDGNVLSETINEYRVYVRDLLPVIPEGTISLEILAGGETKGKVEGLAINEDGYAVFYPDDVKSLMGEETEAVVRASYVAGDDSNYEIESNDLTIYSDEASLYLSKHLQYSVPIGASANAYQFLIYISAFPYGNVPEGTVYHWYNLENDVVKLVPTSNGGSVISCEATYKIGTAVIRGYVDVPEGTEGIQDFYISMSVEVTKANVGINTGGKTVTYDGNAHELEFWTQEYDPDTGTWVGVPLLDYDIVYRETFSKEEVGSSAVDAGRYQYTITMKETEYTKERTQDSLTTYMEVLVIEPALPTIQLSDKTVAYSGMPQEIDDAILEGVPGGSEVTGAVTYTYVGVDGTEYNSTEAPIEVGTYQVTATVAADGNYSEASTETPAYLTIESSDCEIIVDAKTVTYTGDPVTADYKVYDEYGTELSTEGVQVYYRDSLKYESVKTTEPPTEAGIYYVWAQREADENYHSAVSKVVLLVIERADVEITVEGDFSVPYTGKMVDPYEIFDASVISENGTDITEQSEIYYVFHQSHKGRVKIEPPVRAGVYYVKAVALGQDNYKRAESELIEFHIEKAKPKLYVTLNDIVYGETIADTTIAGTATGVNDESLNGVFSINDDNCHQILDVGEYEVEIIFDPEGEDSDNYESGTAEATLVIGEIAVEAEAVRTSNGICLKGILKGLLDNPKGTFSVYKKLSSESADKFQLLKNNIKIVKSEDGYGFELVLDIKEKGSYDFKIVYQDEETGDNIIVETLVEDVQIGYDTNVQENVANTGDRAPIFLYVLLIVISMGTTLAAFRYKRKRG